MTTNLDLRPAAERMAGLVEALRDDDLAKATPCEHYTVGDLVDHVGGAALAFTAAAVKKPMEGSPSGDASRLGPDWRTRIPADVRALGHAWQDGEAWQGMTAAGGVDLPGEVAGVVALDELLIHGWDLAKATGQDTALDPELVDACWTVLNPQIELLRGSGMFGNQLDVPDDADSQTKLLATLGRRA